MKLINTPIKTIIQTHKESESIKQTAKECETSTQRVRKILVANGLYSSERSERTKQLLEANTSIDEMEKILKVSRNCIMSYLPYQRKPYGVNRTQNAIDLHYWRYYKKRKNK